MLTRGQELIKDLTDEELVALAQASVLEASVRGVSVPGVEFSGSLALLGSEVDVPTYVPEYISEQLPGAYKAYRAACNILGIPKAHEETAILEFAKFVSPSKIDYVSEKIEQDPELEYTLVARPNVPVSSSTLEKLTRVLAEDKPMENLVDSLDVYGQYEDEELTGITPASDDSEIVFVLVPSKPDRLLKGDIYQQNIILNDLNSSGLGFLRVPSAVEAIMYYFTMQSNGKVLSGLGMKELTNIRHFDMKPKYDRIFESAVWVPNHSIDENGSLRIKYSITSLRAPAARLVVG